MMINMERNQDFVITLRGGAISINELKIDAEVAARVVRLIMPLPALIGGDLSNQTDRDASENEGEDSQRALSAKQFMTLKQPKSDIERIVCLAFYLAHYKETSQFKTIDITHLNVEAAQPKLSNASFTARNAVAQQYLAPAGGGRKQITPRGEALIKAMPDRSKVKEALEQFPLHGKKRRPSSRASKK